MSLDEEVLQPYVERLLDVQSQRAESMNSDELRDVAYQLGLSDDDLQAAAETAEHCYQRGLGYLEHGRVDDAVKDLETAAALEPERTDMLAAAACAYRDRFLQAGDKEDRAKAERFAKRCLELDPQHEDSFQVLNDLDGQATSTSAVGTRGQRYAGVRGRLLLLALFLMGFGMFFYLIAGK